MLRKKFERREKKRSTSYPLLHCNHEIGSKIWLSEVLFTIEVQRGRGKMGGKKVKGKRTQKRGREEEKEKNFLREKKERNDRERKWVKITRVGFYFREERKEEQINAVLSFFISRSKQWMSVQGTTFILILFPSILFKPISFLYFFPFFLSLTFTSIPFFLLVCDLFFSIVSLQHKKVHTARAIWSNCISHSF